MDRDMDALGKYQWGYLAWDDLLLFMSEKQARRAIDEGRYIRKYRGLYRIAGVTETWRHGAMAAYLAAGTGGAGGLCAGKLHGIPSVPCQKVELLVPRPAQPRLPGVVIRRSTFLPDDHLMNMDALRIVTPARAICDMSARLSATTLARALRGAVRFDVTSYEDVGRTLQEIRARGRRRTTVIDQILAGRLAGTTPGDSESEYKLLEWISKAGLPLPKQQLWVVTEAGRYCLDYAYPDEKINLEWDSDLHERTPDDVEYDAVRDSELTLVGWLVMRASRMTSRATYIRRLETALTQRAR